MQVSPFWYSMPLGYFGFSSRQHLVLFKMEFYPLFSHSFSGRQAKEYSCCHGTLKSETCFLDKYFLISFMVIIFLSGTLDMISLYSNGGAIIIWDLPYFSNGFSSLSSTILGISLESCHFSLKDFSDHIITN